MTKRAKLTNNQFKLLLQLYKEQGKEITEQTMYWMENLPKQEASKLIDNWILKNRRRKKHY